MLVKLFAVLVILVGIAGLVLPIIPGALLIVIGVLMLYRERHEEINRLVNEKAPHWLSDLYNNVLHRILLPKHYVGVDWDYVKKELLKTERIEGPKDGRLTDIAGTAARCMKTARSLVHPRYAFGEIRVNASGDASIEAGGVTLNTKRISEFIKGAQGLIVAVVTIGGALEKEASALTSGSDPLCGYLLDRIGSLAVESLADRLEKSLRYDYGARRKSVSSRFSPGYCYWPIEEQLKLDRLLAFAEAGVTLNEACMMVPKKSISCIMAVADEGVFREFVSSCDICEKQECDFRR